MHRFRPLATTLPFLLAMLAGPATLSAQQPQMPPPPVSVLELRAQPLPVVNELPGRVSATRTAEVRPRVSGIVLERVFEQGSFVQEGSMLYRIDPSQYAVAMASAEATLARANANQLNARDQQSRAEALRERRVTSGVELENAVTNLAIADAEVAIAQAQLDQARLNLNYTEVTAPISGVIGRALVTEGALVSAQTDVLATIQQLDPIYVDFTQSSTEMFALRRARASGQLNMVSDDEAQVHLMFDDGSEYTHPGKLLFSEANVDSTTGQITLRAEFPNPDGDLLPGLYVRIRIEQAVRENALTIPQMAVQRDQSGQAYVYVMKSEDTVERRNVTLGRTTNNQWLVEDGLEPGERVVVAGAQKLYPDAKVVPEPVDAPAEATGAEDQGSPAPDADQETDQDEAAQPAE
ncbi:efflux RND transporter periplasmic adaptor subunit [uncultured Paracoccus sp.]|uniref:efflux RND transporter periplasmic adaptor subunit n=1 Tax=uncultured Paracoccus sp. TaxID=189685 RepID=UPI0025D0FAB2|nr:efflux RND transporter periplasmic adaptor subunit [uncultured Paracoccus sp.]